MSDVHLWRRDEVPVLEVATTREFVRCAADVCEKALNDAKAGLHPLLRNEKVARLERRNEFTQAFKSALEKRIARKIAIWQPIIQSVFRFDESRATNNPVWDGKIHLLVKVPRLSMAVKTLERSLDKSLLGCLKQLGWQCFQKQPSILDLQQVTVSELRHGVSYGAMFCAVYSVPVKVWPSKR